MRLYEPTPGEKMECNTGYILHHISTIVSGCFVPMMPHIPWFLSLVFTNHAFLVVNLGLSNLQPIYGLTVAYMQYRLCQEPFWSSKIYRRFWTSNWTFLIGFGWLLYNG